MCGCISKLLSLKWNLIHSMLLQEKNPISKIYQTSVLRYGIFYIYLAVKSKSYFETLSFDILFNISVGFHKWVRILLKVVKSK